MVSKDISFARGLLKEFGPDCQLFSARLRGFKENPKWRKRDRLRLKVPKRPAAKSQRSGLALGSIRDFPERLRERRTQRLCFELSRRVSTTWQQNFKSGRSNASPTFMGPSKKVDLKIIIIGALGVGKTSLLHQYIHKRFYEDYRTTLGASILSKVMEVDHTPLKLQIWDTGGQERFRSIVSTFYKGSDGCMLAFDVTDMDSFESLDVWRNDFLQKVNSTEQGFPMIVLGNKIDLEDRQVSKEMASSWCKEKDIAYFEVSAKNDINVVQAFETLTRQALSRYQGMIESYLTESIKLSPEDQPTTRCC
ncbi:ras-related protein Rab-7b [Crotalus adamanteus]|uniref:Ras-related protein Rab-7b n=2 Tax=Crotalus adamanteus TaxID=8729 RepID=A0AAW1BRR2_CROAD